MPKSTPDPTGGENHPLVAATRKGYLGTVPDDTPNAAYTVAGQVAGAAAPETSAPADGGTQPAPEGQGPQA